MTYKEALQKRKFETALARPFVFLGRLFSGLLVPKSKHRLFIFSPSADIGGSIMNNADLARLFVDMKPIVIFSKYPKNNQFRHLFDTPGVVTWDLHKLIDNKAYHFVNLFYRGVISKWINRSENAVIIGGESLYFHKVFPWLKQEVKTIELCHLDTWFNYTQQFVKDIQYRVFSTKKLMQDAKAFYHNQGIDPGLTNRLHFIDNMIPMPPASAPVHNEKLEVIFIGRGSPQKRVHLLAETAKKAHERNLPIHFSFVGDVENIIDPAYLPYCTFYGNVKDRKRLLEIQKKSDVLLLTSKFEGLPMVVIEMMSLGKTIVSTAVNAIPDYIKDGVNGYLLPDWDDENKIVEDAIIALSILAADRELLVRIGKHNREEAVERFGEEAFKRNWNKLIR